MTTEIVGKESAMKKLLAALGLSALITAPAMAADLARRPPPPAPAPVYIFSWTGCYVGGNVRRPVGQ